MLNNTMIHNNDSVTHCKCFFLMEGRSIGIFQSADSDISRSGIGSAFSLSIFSASSLLTATLRFLLVPCDLFKAGHSESTRKVMIVNRKRFLNIVRYEFQTVFVTLLRQLIKGNAGPLWLSVVCPTKCPLTRVRFNKPVQKKSFP